MGYTESTPSYTSVLPTSKLINLETCDMSITKPYMQMMPTSDDKNLSVTVAPAMTASPEPSDDEDDVQVPSVTSPVHNLPYVKTDMLNMPLGKNQQTPITGTTIAARDADHKDLLFGSGGPPATAVPTDNLSYCRIGWDNNIKNDVDLISDPVSEDAPITTHQNRTIGYVPHRHFENKMLKED